MSRGFAEFQLRHKTGIDVCTAGMIGLLRFRSLALLFSKGFQAEGDALEVELG